MLKSDEAVHEDSAVFSASFSSGESLMGSVHTVGGQGRSFKSKFKLKVGTGQPGISQKGANLRGVVMALVRGTIW